MIFNFLGKIGFLSSTATHSSILASALFSENKPDLVNSKLRVTFDLVEFLLANGPVAISSIPLIVIVYKCSFWEFYYSDY